MNRVQIISDKNQRSLKIKSAVQKKINQNKIKRSNITIERLDFLKLLFFNIFSNEFFIFFDLRFLSEIICILFI